MAISYAYITGKITLPDSDIGVSARVVATPLTSNAVLNFEGDRITFGPAVAETDTDGTIKGLGLPVPIVAGVLWRITVEPLVKYYGIAFERAIIGTFEITSSQTFDSLVSPLPTVVVESIFEDVLAARDQSQNARSGAEVARLGAEAARDQALVHEQNAAQIAAGDLDQTTATNMQNPATATGSTLLASDGPIKDRSTRTSFYDDFTTKPNGTIVDGDTSDSGHTYSVLGQVPWAISSGALVNTQSNTAVTQSSYLGVNIGGDVGMVWAEFEVPAGADPLAALTLIASADDFAGAPDYEFSNASAHCTFSPASFRYDALEATHPGLVTTVLGRGQYTSLPPGTYRVEVALDDTLATITAPDGRRWRADTSALIASYNGPWATIQIYNAGDSVTKKSPRILRWGAERQDRANTGAYASAAQIGRAVTQAPRLINAMQTSGANVATGMTTSLSAKLFGLTIPIPPSRRVLCEGAAWFDRSVPVSRAASSLLLGVYPGGTTGYGKLTTLYSGYTPANATADAAAFADRQGAMTAYADGYLFPFFLILDLDPAFQIGDSIDFQVKALAGASGNWTFIDSGSATGSTSTLRRSTLKISELPAT